MKHPSPTRFFPPLRLNQSGVESRAFKALVKPEHIFGFIFVLEFSS